jgi:hypothetical protein
MTYATLIVSYARKENVLKLIEASINSGFENIYLSIDGPRSHEIRKIQSELELEIAKLAKSFSGKILVWQRKVNMGSGASVIASLDWVFSQESEICILEDDLIISEDFFAFMAFGLQEMKRHSDLKIVTGTNPFTNITNNQMGKVNYPVSWGWATNKNNWGVLRELIFNSVQKESSIHKFQRMKYWNVGKRRALLGQIEAWDIPLASEMYKTSFYTLLPPTNLVRNVGFDEFAEHTIESIWPLNLPITHLPNAQSCELDEKFLVNLNCEFEREIFKIQVHHAFTWVIHRFFDRFRFRQGTSTLLARSQSESFPRL